MALDIHRVRQTCSDAEKAIDRAKREVGTVNNAFRNLGSGFTSDPLFTREYSTFAAATREAERALDRLREAAQGVARKAR